MNDFYSACMVMEKQLGHDVQISLATCVDNKVSVRIVDGYYKDGFMYVVTHMSSSKMKEITKNSNVAICRNLFSARGIGENLGNPKEEKNRELAKELRGVFIVFYDKHVNENDPLTCILRIKLEDAVVFTNDKKYIIDYKNQIAEQHPFHNDIVFE